MRIGAQLKQAWVVIFLAVGLVYVAYYFHTLAPRLALTPHLSLDALWLAAAIQIVCLLLLANLWRVILVDVSATKLTLMQSLTQLALLLIGKYLPGKIWGMVARGAHAKRYGVERSFSLVATYLEQALLLHAAILLCGAILAWKYDWPWLGVVMVAILLGGPLLLHRLWNVLGWLARLFPRLRLPPRFVTPSIWRYAELVLAYTLTWVMNAAVLVALFHASFDRPLTWELIGALALANTAGISIGFFALFAPGGIGVREVVTSMFLVHSMSLADAALLSLLYRFWLVGWELLLGGVFALHYFITREP